MMISTLRAAMAVALVAVAGLSDIHPAQAQNSIRAGAESEIAPVEDVYQEMTLQNLSKMYWAVAMLDFDDMTHIDNYLRINECEMYQKFYHDDLEWREIRRATVDHIRNNVVQGAQKFEIIMPIYLGRYDPGTAKFEVLPDSQFLSVTRLETGHNSNSESVCGKAGNIPGYPRNIVLQVSLPFTLAEVPVQREVADLYMEEAMRLYEKLPPEVRLRRYERAAYVRLKVTLMQFKEIISTGNGPPKPVIFGRIDGYEIFADQGKQLLMYSESFEHRSIKRRRVKREDPTLAQDASPQQQPSEQQPQPEQP